MGVSLADSKAGLSPESRARTDAHTKQIIAELEGLRPLRTAMDNAHAALAERLDVPLADVAQRAAQAELLLSALREHVERLGGKLNSVIRFPGHPEVRIEEFRDIPESAVAPKRTSRSPVRPRAEVAA